MPNLFDEFDLEVQKINTDIMLLEDSCSDSVAHCSSGSGGGGGSGTPHLSLVWCSVVPKCRNVSLHVKVSENVLRNQK